MGKAAAIHSVADAQQLARRRLPKSVYQAIEGGAARGVTIHANARAFDDVFLGPKAGLWTPAPELGVTVVGQRLASPLILAPTGNLRLYHRDGEAGAARAAGAGGATMCVGTLTGTAIEDVASAATGPLFFQLYFLGDRDLTLFAIERARKAGCKALVLSLDDSSHIPRERALGDRAMPVFEAMTNLRNMVRFLPQALSSPAWAIDMARNRDALYAPMGRARSGAAMPFLQAIANVFSPAVAPIVWDDIAWLRDAWDGPIIAKGILRADDARRAVDLGVDAIIVSNHGGMCCDGASASLHALPSIVAAVGDRADILFDGGIRHGLDVIKAMALGARAVLIGHAFIWPFAAAGEAGVRRILDLLNFEMMQGLRYLGCPAIEQLGSAYLAPDRAPTIQHAAS